MIHVHDLWKSYDDVEALRGISFAVRQGEIIGLLGPNGAGKTTVMKILTGFLHQTEGSARVAGLEVMENAREVQALIGYLPENAPLYPELTVQSYLKMIAELREIPKTACIRLLSEAVHAVGLEGRLTRPIGTLSKGYRQRVGLAQAILHKPKLLILDEPTNGLDPTQIVEVRHLIKKLAQESTVLISTHILPEVEATCDRAIIIIRGEIRADAMLSELSATADAHVSLVETGKEAEAMPALAALPGVESVEISDQRQGHLSFQVKGAAHQDLCPDIFLLAKKNGWVLSELRREVRTLEAVFNELAVSYGGVQ